MSANISSRIVYLNGHFLPVDQAYISVMDRGFLFSDGVYEVIPLFDRRLLGIEEHLQRLQRSLEAISLPYQVKHEFFIDIFKTLFTRNPDQGDDRLIYLQITRGVPENREHVFPGEHIHPTIFIQITPFNVPSFEMMQQGGHAITMEDIRWQWCYIKSVALLPNVLSAQKAKEASAKEAILIRDGMVTEGAISNIFIVKNGEMITPPADGQILQGVTRNLMLKLAKENRIPCHEKTISEKELYDAEEVWVTSSSKEIFPIVNINGRVIGSGKAGNVWLKMMSIYQTYKASLPQL